MPDASDAGDQVLGGYIEPAAQQLEDAAMARFIEVDAKISAFVRKIEGSLGAAGHA